MITNKFNSLLNDFNESFELQPTIENIDGEDVITNIKIVSVKNGGEKFINNLYEMINELLSALPEKNQLVFDKDKGLVIAKIVEKEVETLEY